MATRSTHTGGGGGTEQTKDNSSSLSSSSSARARQPPQQQEDRNEDNDEVVASYDVFLTQEMADRLYLLQHRWRRSDHSGYFPVSEATFRPNNKVLELEHKLDKESPHYDTESYNRKRLDTIKTVSHALPFHTCYFVGVKNKDAIHLTPLEGLFEMKTDFSHMANSELHEGPKGDTQEEEEEMEQEPQRLTTRIKRQETERAAVARKRSYRYTQRLIEQEPPIDLNVFHYETEEGEMFREQLISESSTASRIQKPDYTPREYLNVWKSSNSRPNYVTHVVGQTNREVRNNHTLRGELENLLYKGVCLPFRKIQEFVTLFKDDGDLVQELHKVATLIRGNWCLKSSLWVQHVSTTLTNEEKPFVPGTVAHAKACRDFILNQFRKHRAISRPWISRILGIDRMTLREMLEGVAKLNPPLRKWEFRHPDDQEFMYNYPGVVSAMDSAWAKREKELEDIFPQDGGTPEDWEREQLAIPPEIEVLRAQRDRLYQQLRESFEDGGVADDDSNLHEDDSRAHHRAHRKGSDTMILNSDDIDAAREIFRKEFLNHGVCNIRYLAGCLRRSVASATDHSGALSAIPFLEDQTLYLVVQKILLGQSEPITETEQHSDLPVAGAETSPMAVCLRQGPPPSDDDDLEEENVGRQRSGSTGTHSAILGESAYALWERNNEAIDPFRKVVIDLFCSGNTMLKRADVTKAVNESLQREIPPNVYNKVMRELATSKKAHCWVLKTGDPKTEG